ncbi:MAG TPA: methyl-accepting chemotaxis protein [Oscillatoriaceae cyanobacterium M33_DOE_052]|uniref:Methyl-accepting chemotaxis protein n=1 Tax=Planktothricoides sp. SpSt-374 TaxID=2282167 RepID=A0A7C3VJR0_9CYAN|nr:methyl-accepting chemotaxis protein [Oscillatoriaceae cyanobacterium M33_DOE_052]
MYELLKNLTQKVKDSSVNRKISIVGGVVLFQIATLSGLFAIQMYGLLLESDRRSILANADRVALQVEAKYLESIAVTKSMALAQQNGLFGQWAASANYARAILQENEQFLGVYFAYEPDVYSTLESRYTLHWFRDSQDENKILTLNINDANSPAYQSAKQNFGLGAGQQPFISEPQLEQGEMVVKPTYPIVIGGKFLGIAGVEVSLKGIKNFLDQLKPYPTAEFLLISSTGTIIAATLDNSLTAQNIRETAYAENFNILFVKIQNDKDRFRLLRDPKEQKRYYYAGATIQTGNWKVIMRVDEKEVLLPVFAAGIKLLLIAAFGISITYVFIRWIAGAISKQVKWAVTAAEQVAQGDLTSRVQITSGDEIGQLLGAIQTMTDKLNSLISQVQQSGIQVTSSATQIAATGRQLEATVTEQLASTQEVVATTQEIAATSEELAETMNEVASLSAETAAAAAKGKQEILRMEAAMGNMASATNSISDKLGTIGEKAKTINNIITTITKVADQTNLLSLNAAIEAEKAGQYGKGFAVVAREIRRLADQTAVATLDIESTIAQMQAAVTDGTTEVEKFTLTVSHNVEDVRQIGRQLAQIAQQVQALTPRFAIVNQGMAAQVLGARQIGEAMMQLSEASAQTADSLRETNAALEGLNDAAQTLRQEISQFKVGDAGPTPHRLRLFHHDEEPSW